MAPNLLLLMMLMIRSDSLEGFNTASDLTIHFLEGV